MGWFLRSGRAAYGVYAEAGERHIALIAAGVAFFGMFGIFPGIAAIISVFGLMADPSVVSQELALMEDVIPPETYAIFQGQVDQLLSAPSDALSWATAVSILLALWSSRAAVAAMIGGINAIEGVPTRSGIRQALVAFGLTVALVALAITALLTVVILPIVLAFLPLPQFTAWMLEIARWLMALFVLFGGLSILYRFGPNMAPHRRPWFTVGAAGVVVAWIAASVGLSYYLTNFASYNEVYGSIGAVIGMLLWLYVSAYLILLGAVVNARLYPVQPPCGPE